MPPRYKLVYDPLKLRPTMGHHLTEVLLDGDILAGSSTPRVAGPEERACECGTASGERFPAWSPEIDGSGNPTGWPSGKPPSLAAKSAMGHVQCYRRVCWNSEHLGIQTGNSNLTAKCFQNVVSKTGWWKIFEADHRWQGNRTGEARGVWLALPATKKKRSRIRAISGSCFNFKIQSLRFSGTGLRFRLWWSMMAMLDQPSLWNCRKEYPEYRHYSLSSYNYILRLWIPRQLSASVSFQSPLSGAGE